MRKFKFTSLYCHLILASVFTTTVMTGLLLLWIHYNHAALSGQEIAVIFVVVSVATWWLASVLLRSFKQRVEALRISLLNLQDGEFNATVVQYSDDELGQSAKLVNQVAESLRKERQNIYHRELLLDKVNQNSPLAMLLFDQDQRLIYSNLAARKWLNNGQKLDGACLADIATEWPQPVTQAIEAGQDGLFVLEPASKGTEDVSQLDVRHESQTWHLSTGDFQLNGQQHKLYLFKPLTREFNRQEVTVWKKVIRVISHEINNSIAPISSMVHSGKLLIEKQNNDKLSLIFNTIDSRIKHLNQFIAGYAEFARLPEPKYQKVDWPLYLKGLQQQYKFSYSAPLDSALQSLQLDASQFEQLMINLLKNAHESDSAPDDIGLDIELKTGKPQMAVFTVRDRGKGMNAQELQNALIPFYSTKQGGSGLGLALSREIVEAHHGQISLQNRTGGGLMVRVGLPF